MTDPRRYAYSDITLVLCLYQRVNNVISLLDNYSKFSGHDKVKFLISCQDDLPEAIVRLSARYSNVKVVRYRSEGGSPLDKMIFHRISASEEARKLFFNPIEIHLEDDVFPGFDFISFVLHIFNTYSDDSDFKLVNLGSHMPYDEKLVGVYGKFRYGLFGQCFGVSSEYWHQRLLPSKEEHKANPMGIDQRIFKELFKGFVIMPYCSRYIDCGWDGTHAPPDSDHPYFSGLRQSFIGVTPMHLVYKEQQFEFQWPKLVGKYFNNLAISRLWFWFEGKKNGFRRMLGKHNLQRF